MTQKEAVQYWRQSARRNHQVAKDLIEIKRYDWSLFLYHLTIEKLLKACVIQAGTVPPYTHDLLKLAKLANLFLTDEYRAWLEEIAKFNIEARYEEEKIAFYKKANVEFTKKWSSNCEKIIKWLKQNINN